jgi:hypothetical protein
MGNATVSGGVATFPGTVASGPGSDYIQLPPGLISNYTTVTFEFWIDPGLSVTWVELYAFGNQDSGHGANMLMFCPHSGPDDFRMSYAQADPGYNDEHVTGGGGLLDNLGPCSVACVYDPPNNTITLYRNGALVSSLSPVTTGALAFSLTNVYNVNSWLGRSLYDGDGSYTGTLEEFRIYNSALSQTQVAVDNALGPKVVATNMSLAGGTWTVNTNMILGERQDSVATLGFTYNGSQSVSANVPNFIGPTYSSGNTNVVTITPLGRLFAMGAGSTTVTAAYSGFTFTNLVTVSAAPKLMHRYSFTADASDSVGTANGTLMGGATITGGQVVLSGVGSSSSPGDYVELPGQLFTNLTSVSLETWVTDNGSSTWARIWDFGISVTGQGNSGGGGDNLFLTTPSGGGFLRGSINVGGRGEQQVNTSPLVVGSETHVVYINDAAHQVSYLYVNGALAAQNSGATDTPADLGGTLNDWLGRSQYGDPLFNGSIDEFRIWEGPLSPLQVAINTASGPDKIVFGLPGPVQALHLSVNTNMIRGGQQRATVTADFTGLTGLNVSSAGTTYTSSSTNVATVDATGLIQALDIGTTKITATFSNMSASQVITVTVKPTILADRWNFNETSGTTVHDVVGTANGTLSPTGATLDGTNVNLDGIAGYVDLPGHLIDGFDAVTFEGWLTVISGTPNDSSARLFEFGSADAVNELGMVALGGANASALFYGPAGNLSVRRQKGLDTVGKVHLVVNYNPPLGTIDFFLNGHWQNTLTNLNFTLASITNSAARLGANLGGLDFTAVTIDDFRIYNGALGLFGIRANFAAGPNLVATNLGAPTSLTLNVDPSMVQGSRSVPHAWASFASVTNVDVTQTAEVAYSSSDTTVVSITPDGLVEAVGPGSATVTAAFGGLKTVKPVTVFSKQTMLLHRYSFTSDASDSVGAQDGTLWGNATISGDQVNFDGDGNSYVELPSRLISSYDAVSFEFWATVGVNGIWARIFDFGHYTDQADGGGQSYVFFCPHTGGTLTRICLSDGTEANLDCGPPLDGDSNVHLVVLYDPTTDTESLYTNGVLAASGGLAGKKLSGVNDLACWLGRSMYSGDSGLTASIDEFRLYAGALTPAQITADYAAGSETVVLPPPTVGPPKLLASSSPGNIVIAWPTNATGFTLLSAPNLAAPVVWSPVGITPVVANGMNEVTVPTTNKAAYFRLKK